jgi:hypothetical protein
MPVLWRAGIGIFAYQNQKFFNRQVPRRVLCALPPEAVAEADLRLQIRRGDPTDQEFNFAKGTQLNHVKSTGCLSQQARKLPAYSEGRAKVLSECEKAKAADWHVNQKVDRDSADKESVNARRPRMNKHPERAGGQLCGVEFPRIQGSVHDQRNHN